MLIKNRPFFFLHVILSLQNNSVTRNRYCCVIFECASAFQLFPYFIFISSFSLYNIPSLTFVLDIFITNDRVIFSSSRFRIIHLQLIKVILSRQICILDNVIIHCFSLTVNKMYFLHQYSFEIGKNHIILQRHYFQMHSVYKCCFFKHRTFNTFKISSARSIFAVQNIKM